MKGSVCTEQYNPVCVTVRYDDILEDKNAGNPCKACHMTGVMWYMQGKCPNQTVDNKNDNKSIDGDQEQGFCKGKYEACTEEYRNPPYCGIVFNQYTKEILKVYKGGNECQVCSKQDVQVYFIGECDQKSADRVINSIFTYSTSEQSQLSFFLLILLITYTFII